MNIVNGFLRLATPAERRLGPNEVSSFADHAIELLLLAIVAAGPRDRDQFADLLGRIACPVLQPTAEVIDDHLRSLEQQGLVETATDRNGTVTIRRTAAGARRLRDMLRMPGPPASSIHHELAFGLKVCLLDLMDAEDRSSVVQGLLR